MRGANVKLEICTVGDLRKEISGHCAGRKHILLGDLVLRFSGLILSGAWSSVELLFQRVT